MLPDFIIGGERRSGTTSLLRYLSPHPQIFTHPEKDKGWFIDDSVRKRPDFSPWEETHKIEDYARWFEKAAPPPGAKIAEKSADYLFWRKSHKRLAQYLPETKFIFVLRNPITRAWSHYWNEVAKGRERLNFAEALERENTRIKTDDYHLYNFSYKARGHYQQSLSHFFEHIPQERCLILAVEHLWAEPEKNLNNICHFLGVDEGHVFELHRAAYNSNWAVSPKAFATNPAIKPIAKAYARSVDLAAKAFFRQRDHRREVMIKLKTPFFVPARELEMPREVKRALRAEFHEPNQQLSRHLNIDLDIWNS